MNGLPTRDGEGQINGDTLEESGGLAGPLFRHPHGSTTRDPKAIALLEDLRSGSPLTVRHTPDIENIFNNNE